MIDPVLAARYRALALQGLERTSSPFASLPDPLLVVDPVRQRIGRMEGGSLRAEFPVSTAANGLGCEDGSYKTPLGWHRIHQRIGEGAPEGMIFKARQATGERWQGEAREEDLILTRVLTLEGLEPGVNQGPGCDSRLRWIYLHGTNQETSIGTACSHGCIRLRNGDLLRLFEQVKEGDVLLVADPACEPPGALGLGRLHFTGVGGSGMSALGQFVAMRGGRVSGSDRSFDRGQFQGSQSKLEALGITVLPQDGGGARGDCAAVVCSTAVEDQVPDLVEARRLGVPLLHRSELLAHLVARHRTLAVTGTSGKSTTTAMVFELLRGAGRDPSLLTGGELVALQEEGLWGNAWAGASDLLVIEADESDGSLVRYHPAVGVILNLQRDHKEEHEVAEMFQTFKGQVQERCVVGEAENLRPFAADSWVFGFNKGAHFRVEDLEMGAEGSAFRVGMDTFRVPLPGQHNAENALAALAACQAVGVPLSAMVEPLARFRGVARRFQCVGQRRGIRVVDDFAHNPAKIEASLRAAKLQASRVLAIFQPHGFGPLRFLRAGFVETFVRELRSQDALWMLDVFYAGGTVNRDIGSPEVVQEMAAQGTKAYHSPSRASLISALAQEAKEGDLILLMGARDPSLTELALQIVEAL